MMQGREQEQDGGVESGRMADPFEAITEAMRSSRSTSEAYIELLGLSWINEGIWSDFVARMKHEAPGWGKSLGLIEDPGQWAEPMTSTWIAGFYFAAVMLREVATEEVRDSNRLLKILANQAAMLRNLSRDLRRLSVRAGIHASRLEFTCEIHEGGVPSKTVKDSVGEDDGPPSHNNRT